MPEFCTCGAQLPPDALFCHKCGKPQREDLILVAEEPALLMAEPPPALPVEPPPIGWRNRSAVRVSLFAGIFAFVFAVLMGPLSVIALVASGILAVFLYRRLTGLPVSARNGARLGWITGIFLFVAALLMLTLAFATQPEVFDQLQKRLVETSQYTEAEAKQVMEILRSPVGIVLWLLLLFVLSTLLPAVGGALGAKLLGGGGSSPHEPHA